MPRTPEQATEAEITSQDITDALDALPDVALLSTLLNTLVSSYNETVRISNRNMDLLR